MSATRLRTVRLELHPLDVARHSGALYAILADRRVWSAMGASGPPVAATEADKLATRMAENGGWGWIIRASGTNQIIGSVSLFPGDDAARSLTWYLHANHWGKGLGSEAVSTVVNHMLGTAGFSRVEAWIDHTNHRSIGVARNAGMTERGRMAYYSAVQATIVHNVVMGRAAGDPAPALLGLRPQLVVRDVEQVSRLLVEGLGMHADTRTPGVSADERRVAISAFSGAPAIALRQASDVESIAPTVVEVDVGYKVGEYVSKCTALGMQVTAPTQVHWYRCCEVEIGDGHRIRLRGSRYPAIQDRPEAGRHANKPADSTP